MAVTHELVHRGLATPTDNRIALEERFEVLKDIGDGSFGSVVLARVRGAGSSVARRGTIIAIKTMKKQFDSFAPCLELREVVFLRTLPVHQHLVPALDIFLDPFTKKLHIAMEYMDGNLYQLMKARDHKPMDGASVKSILFQIMQGLEHIHNHHFFHRDIKPENILVTTSAQAEGFRRYSSMATPPSTPPVYTVKIADFGLARETHSKLPYTTYVSTRWYRAPEVLLRAGEYSAPVDIWAMGAMAVEIATLKPLFPGGNEVDQVWRVCEIMGSPGNWYNKDGVRVGGGDWKEGTKLAGKLGFSFPKMAPHAMNTILQAPQWPAALSEFVTWCLMWDPKARPTSAQALAHEYFVGAVDPLRPRSSSSKQVGRKHSDLSFRSGNKELDPQVSSKPSWFRKSLIGRGDSTVSLQSLSSGKEHLTTRPAMAQTPSASEIDLNKTRPPPGKRSTWTNGVSAPMPILPTIRPISPLSDAVTAQGTRQPSYNSTVPQQNVRKSIQEEKNARKLGRQLSVYSNSAHDLESHRQQAERALNGKNSAIPPANMQKEGFFSHLRKRARRFSGRHQTPVSPTSDDLESQPTGCGPWASNRSSMIVDSVQAPIPTTTTASMSSTVAPMPLPKDDTYKALDKALRAVQDNLDASTVSARSHSPAIQNQQSGSSSLLKRHHSLPQHKPRSTDNLGVEARASGTIRAKKPQVPAQYDTPQEEDETFNVTSRSTSKLSRRVDVNRVAYDMNNRAVMASAPDYRQTLVHSTNNLGASNPYPTPSPSANGRDVLFGQLTSNPKQTSTVHRTESGHFNWPTPPYEENEWAAAAAASIWAAGSRF